MAPSIQQVLGLATCLLAPANALLSPTPPMGFNDWARYMGGLNQSLFTETADAMVQKGLLKAGYNRINLDDEWSNLSRLPNGSMMWNEEKFPEGLPWLTKYLKNRGFIPGIYTDAGNLSCGGFPGAYGHEEVDADTFTGWGFEYLKLDGCNMPDPTEEGYKTVYGKWHKILTALPDPMVFSESAPAYFTDPSNLTDWYTVMGWVPEFGQLARHSTDILVFNSTAYWPKETGWEGIMNNYGYEVRLARYQRPGYVNDPDFLNFDHPGYTLDEKKSHFALWSSFSAPLILSADVLNMTDAEVDYLTNEDIIAIDQDPLVQQATLVSQAADWDVLTKSLHNGDRLLTVLNKGTKTGSMTVHWERIGISPGKASAPSSLQVKDLWTGSTTSMKVSKGSGIEAKDVPSHGTAIFRLANPDAPHSVQVTPTGQIFNTASLNCLTSSGYGDLSWSNCTGHDGQVWRVSSEGQVTSLRDESQCLVEEKGKTMMVGCDSCSNNEDKWSYCMSGNLINGKSGHCLTEGKAGAASSKKCGYEMDSQVMALPIGVTLN